MFTNAEKLTAVIVKWAKPMVDEVIAKGLTKFQPVQAANAWVRKYFPVAANYSIVNDLSFLAVPATELIVEPIIRSAIAKIGLSDEDIPSYADRIVKSAIEQAESSGCVSLFNTIDLEKSDLEKLRYLLQKNLPVEEFARYEVID